MSNYTQMDPANQAGGAQVATVLCCNCGVPMDGSLGLVMCYDCIKLNVDITEGILERQMCHSVEIVKDFYNHLDNG